jgi:hypothetical protein
VPLHTYERLAPALAQTARGERDILWPGRCTLFARTAGTSTGTPRLIPITEEMLAHVRHAGYDAALFYTVRAKHAGAFRGRQLLFGSPPSLTPLEGASDLFASDLSGLAALNLPTWAERHLYEPGIAAAQPSPPQGAPQAPPAADPATPPLADPAPPPAATPDLAAAKKACADALNADPTFRKGILDTVDKSIDQRTLDAQQTAAAQIAENKRHVIYAYAAMWILAAGFVAFLWYRQQMLKAELVALRTFHDDHCWTAARFRAPPRKR